MSSEAPKSEDASSSPDPFDTGTSASPGSEGSEAEKVEELRAILVRSESGEMPGLHMLTLNASSCLVVALKTALIDGTVTFSREGGMNLRRVMKLRRAMNM